MSIADGGLQHAAGTAAKAAETTLDTVETKAKNEIDATSAFISDPFNSAGKTLGIVTG